MRKLIIRCAAAIGFSLLFATSIQAASSVTFYHHDALGSIIATSDQDGFMHLNEEYQPYGEKIYGTEDPISDNEDWYTGKNYSKELDLTYFGARWYDAKQGRFLSMDPAGVSLASIHSFNRYHYANNNPYAYLDPDGERAIIAIRGFVTRSVGQIKAGFSQFKGARSTPFGPSSELAKLLQRENTKGGFTKGVAPAKRASNQTVLGSYPDYVKLSDKLGARRFDIPKDVWKRMSPDQQWSANRKFLGRMISKGDKVILSNPVSKAQPGTFYAREIGYLKSKGYRLSNDGRRMLSGN